MINAIQEAIKKVLNGEYQNDGPVYRCDIGKFDKTDFHFFMWHRGELSPEDAEYEWDDQSHQGWIELGFDRHGEAAHNTVEGTSITYGWYSHEITDGKVIEAINTIIELKSTFEVMGS
jgi:hypothetical protein